MFVSALPIRFGLPCANTRLLQETPLLHPAEALHLEALVAVLLPQRKSSDLFISIHWVLKSDSDLVWPQLACKADHYVIR